MSQHSCPLCKAALGKGAHECPFIAQQLAAAAAVGGGDGAVVPPPVPPPPPVPATSSTSTSPTRRGTLEANNNNSAAAAGFGSPQRASAASNPESLLGAKVAVVGLKGQRGDVNGATGLVVGVHRDKKAKGGDGGALWRALVKLDPPKQHLDALSFRLDNLAIKVHAVVPAAKTYSIGSRVQARELVADTALNGVVGEVTGLQYSADGTLCYSVTFPPEFGKRLLHDGNIVKAGRMPPANMPALQPVEEEERSVGAHGDNENGGGAEYDESSNTDGNMDSINAGTHANGTPPPPPPPDSPTYATGAQVGVPVPPPPPESPATGLGNARGSGCQPNATASASTAADGMRSPPAPVYLPAGQGQQVGGISVSSFCSTPTSARGTPLSRKVTPKEKPVRPELSVRPPPAVGVVFNQDSDEEDRNRGTFQVVIGESAQQELERSGIVAVKTAAKRAVQAAIASEEGGNASATNLPETAEGQGTPRSGSESNLLASHGSRTRIQLSTKRRTRKPMAGGAKLASVNEDNSSAAGGGDGAGELRRGSDVGVSRVTSVQSQSLVADIPYGTDGAVPPAAAPSPVNSTPAALLPVAHDAGGSCGSSNVPATPPMTITVDHVQAPAPVADDAATEGSASGGSPHKRRMKRGKSKHGAHDAPAAAVVATPEAPAEDAPVPLMQPPNSSFSFIQSAPATPLPAMQQAAPVSNSSMLGVPGVPANMSMSTGGADVQNTSFLQTPNAAAAVANTSFASMTGSIPRRNSDTSTVSAKTTQAAPKGKKGRKAAKAAAEEARKVETGPPTSLFDTAQGKLNVTQMEVASFVASLLPEVETQPPITVTLQFTEPGEPLGCSYIVVQNRVVVSHLMVGGAAWRAGAQLGVMCNIDGREVNSETTVSRAIRCLRGRKATSLVILMRPFPEETVRSFVNSIPIFPEMTEEELYAEEEARALQAILARMTPEQQQQYLLQRQQEELAYQQQLQLQQQQQLATTQGSTSSMSSATPDAAFLRPQQEAPPPPPPAQQPQQAALPGVPAFLQAQAAQPAPESSPRQPPPPGALPAFLRPQGAVQPQPEDAAVPAPAPMSTSSLPAFLRPEPATGGTSDAGASDTSTVPPHPAMGELPAFLRPKPAEAVEVSAVVEDAPSPTITPPTAPAAPAPATLASKSSVRRKRGATNVELAVAAGEADADAASLTARKTRKKRRGTNVKGSKRVDASDAGSSTTRGMSVDAILDDVGDDVRGLDDSIRSLTSSVSRRSHSPTAAAQKAAGGAANPPRLPAAGSAAAAERLSSAGSSPVQPAACSFAALQAASARHTDPCSKAPPTPAPAKPVATTCLGIIAEGHAMIEAHHVAWKDLEGVDHNVLDSEITNDVYTQRAFSPARGPHGTDNGASSDAASMFAKVHGRLQDASKHRLDHLNAQLEQLTALRARYAEVYAGETSAAKVEAGEGNAGDAGLAAARVRAEEEKATRRARLEEVKRREDVVEEQINAKTRDLREEDAALAADIDAVDAELQQAEARIAAVRAKIAETTAAVDDGTAQLLRKRTHASAELEEISASVATAEKDLTACAVLEESLAAERESVAAARNAVDDETERLREDLQEVEACETCVKDEATAQRTAVVALNKLRYNVRQAVQRAREAAEARHAAAVVARQASGGDIQTRAADVAALERKIAATEAAIAGADMAALEQEKAEAAKARDFKRAKAAQQEIVRVRGLQEAVLPDKEALEAARARHAEAEAAAAPLAAAVSAAREALHVHHELFAQRLAALLERHVLAVITGDPGAPLIATRGEVAELSWAGVTHGVDPAVVSDAEAAAERQWAATLAKAGDTAASPTRTGVGVGTAEAMAGVLSAMQSMRTPTGRRS